MNKGCTEKTEGTRFQFGGFVTSKLNFTQKWMNEYESFYEEETTEKTGRRRSDLSNMEMKKMEYDALDRQRRLKAQKFNERKKAALEKKLRVCCTPLSSPQFESSRWKTKLRQAAR